MSEGERERARSKEEEDQFARSKKKAKASSEDKDHNSLMNLDAGCEEIVELKSKDEQGMVVASEKMQTDEDEVVKNSMAIDVSRVEETILNCNKEQENGINVNEIIQEVAENLIQYAAENVMENKKKFHKDKPSYKDRLIGTNGVDVANDYSDDDFCDEDFSEFEDTDDEVGGIKAEFCPRVKVFPEEKIEWCKPWRKSLIVKLIGKKVGIRFLRNRIERLWHLKCNMDLIDLENDFFLVRLADPRDYEFALHGGPWIIAEHYLTVQLWKPDFNPFDVKVKRLAVWGRLSPVEGEGEKKEKEDNSFLGEIAKEAEEETDGGRFPRGREASEEETFGPWMMAPKKSSYVNKGRLNNKYQKGSPEKERKENEVVKEVGSRFAILNNVEEDKEEGLEDEQEISQEEDDNMIMDIVNPLYVNQVVEKVVNEKIGRNVWKEVPRTDNVLPKGEAVIGEMKGVKQKEEVEIRGKEVGNKMNQENKENSLSQEDPSVNLTSFSVMNETLKGNNRGGGGAGNMAEILPPEPPDLDAEIRRLLGENNVHKLMDKRKMIEDKPLLKAAKLFPQLMRDMKKFNYINLMSIYEPKISGEKAKKVISKLGWNNYYMVDVRGFSGGIWICWDDHETDVKVLNSFKQAVHMEVSIKSVRKIFLYTSVYASPRSRERKELWDFLRNIADNHDKPWLIYGDFNAYLKSGEKRGGADPNWATMKSFQDCVDYCNLLDLGISGYPFTKGGRKEERPFRFEAAWLTEESLKDVVNKAWRNDAYWSKAANVFASDPVVLNKGGPDISYLFFADDCVLFAEASKDQAEIMQRCLKVFRDSSGQKVSCDKTKLFCSKNVGHARVNDISSALGVNLTTNLGKYLGVKLNHEKSCYGSFKDVIEKVRRRLSLWKANSLTMAGRITRSKAVLEAIPTYSMQTSLLPKKVCKEIEKLSRDFVWGSNAEKRKPHLVKWESVCSPKEMGGVGLRRIEGTNTTLMMKLGWGLIKNIDSLWVRALRIKYRCGSDVIPTIKKRKNASNVWQGIKKAWNKFSSKKGKDRSKNSNALAAKKDETFKKSGNKHNIGDGGGPKGNSSHLNCYFCKRKGHKKAECRTYKAWLKVGNGADVAVQFVGKVVLNLESGFQLVLKDTFYIPSSRRNLVSISALDKAGYCFNFGNNKVDIFYNSKMICECILSGGMYKLYSSLKNECLHVESTSAKRSNTKEQSFLLWHKRLGYISRERVDRLIKDQGSRFYSPTRGTRIVEALTAKFLELDMAESIFPQPPEMPESSTSVSIPLPSLTEAFPPVTVREETVTLLVLDGDPGMPVPEIPQHHGPRNSSSS
ncbi:putative ribonuclease H protein At1g65750 family [Senna tora]|uniref:Putative ribonuclease H protein At1g65750 family n=1 Tax=Senna tora TaxID=362788 RepID=A0A834XEU7_9FABA|nr:putative ribonuclease H protein At1g65750 family [Senna tora]